MLFTSSACIRDTDEHEDVEEEADDVGVDGKRGEGPVLGVVAVLVLPQHDHLCVHQQEHHLCISIDKKCLSIFYLVQDSDGEYEIYHDKGAKPPIDHLESIEGVAILHLQSSVSRSKAKPGLLQSYQTTPGNNGKDDAEHKEKNS